MTPLLIRCEATAALGTGHALRCLALAQEWMRRGGRIVFAMLEPEPAIGAQLERSGVRVAVLGSVSGSGADALETATLARSIGAGWVVVDGPMFGAEWDAAWPGEQRLLRIDDNGLGRPFRADVLLNQNLGAATDDYPRQAGPCRLLLGADYVLLRPEFLQPGVKLLTRAERVVVTLGGSDPACATERVLEAMRHQGARALEADFIIGAANPRRDVLTAAIEREEPRLRAVVSPANLADRFARAALAVTAGGSTLYELALVGTPMLVLCTAENQRRTCERFAAAGAAQFAGWHADVAPAALAGLLADLAGDESRKAAYAGRSGCLVDGHGAARVIEVMLGGGT